MIECVIQTHRYTYINLHLQTFPTAASNQTFQNHLISTKIIKPEQREKQQFLKKDFIYMQYSKYIITISTKIKKVKQIQII